MSQRIADGQLKKLATDLGRFPDNSRFIGHEVVTAAILDLRDARAEIADLKEQIKDERADAKKAVQEAEGRWVR